MSAHAGAHAGAHAVPAGRIPRRIPAAAVVRGSRRETIGERGGGAASGGDADGCFSPRPPRAPRARCPEALAPTLGAVLSDRTVLKAGFGLAEDMRRLSTLHPAAFAPERAGGPVGGVGPIVDLQRVWAEGTRVAREEAQAAKGGRRGGRGEEDGANDAAAAPPLAGPWSRPEEYTRRHAAGLSASRGPCWVNLWISRRACRTGARVRSRRGRRRTPRSTRGCWWNSCGPYETRADELERFASEK